MRSKLYIIVIIISYYICKILFHNTLIILISMTLFKKKFSHRNSLNPICLAEYGGPVDPAIAFGGFGDSEQGISSKISYTSSKSLVLTLVLNNHLEKERLEPVLKWEKM